MEDVSAVVSAPIPAVAPEPAPEFAPKIMKCALGGWLVEIPGAGVAARSTLGEAIAFLELQAIGLFGEEKPPAEPVPAMFEMERPWELDTIPWYKRVGSFLGLKSTKMAEVQ